MRISRDTLLGGRVQLFQPEKGFRATTDSLLLSAALPEGRTRALELGCGCGGALLPAAWRLTGTYFTGLEIDPEAAALARRGVDANRLGTRVEIIEGDAAGLREEWENRFDLVFANPPYFRPGEISAPGKGKAAAYLESLSLSGWIAAMLFAARPKGMLVLIHRAAELPALMAALDRRAGEITVMPVRAHARADAGRVIIRARKGLRPGPARLLAGIDLHEGKAGPVSETMRAVKAGQGLDWSRRG
ncbi:MAG: methyltransferase domain-containing protein [Alphaproteobacteria bacterium]|nr:methyltransferase domain-containing protein [Alphaproteobacteria bacterium]